jgi:hypothetical protein
VPAPTLLDLEVREGGREETRVMHSVVGDAPVGVLGGSADEALGRDGELRHAPIMPDFPPGCSGDRWRIRS